MAQQKNDAPVVETKNSKSFNDSTENIVKRDTTVSGLLDYIEDVTLTLNTANSILERGFDTAEIADLLPGAEEIIKSYELTAAKDERLTSLRTLKSARNILTFTISDLKKWQAKLSGYGHQTADISSKLGSIREDSGWAMSRNKLRFSFSSIKTKSGS